MLLAGFITIGLVLAGLFWHWLDDGDNPDDRGEPDYRNNPPR